MATFEVKISARRRRGLPNARDLVVAQAKALRKHLSDSLINGVHPVDGAARPRKGDGKPLGFLTGTLARGLRITEPQGGRARSSVRVRAPNSRAFLSETQDGETFLGKHEILTTDGLAARVIAKATSEYIQEINDDGRQRSSSI